MAYVLEGRSYSGLGATAGASVPTCLDCVTQKQTAYEACSKLTFGSAERQACFRTADTNVDTCLKSCKKGRTATALIGIAAGALLASRLA